MVTNKHELNREQFFDLLRAGLFSERCARILSHGSVVEWNEVYRLTEEQAVMGLVTAGIDNLNHNVGIPQEWNFQFIGAALQIEQQNRAMNEFVARLIKKLREEGIFTLLVKGQGIAQCYEKPLWRTCGDVDLLLNVDNYSKACEVLGKIADSAGRETEKNKLRKHQEYQIDGWTVELHGTMHSNLSRRIDREIDAVQRECFYGGKVRSWNVITKESRTSGTQVFLPGSDEDVMFVFTHILQHLFLEGIGLRQICDWCRLLWTYRNELDVKLLEHRLRKTGLMSEWKVFAALAVNKLKMPVEAIPFYDSSERWCKKSERICDYIMEVGNFGHNRNVEWTNSSKRRRTLIWHRITDTVKLSRVFPIDAPKFLLNYVFDGVRGVLLKK